MLRILEGDCRTLLPRLEAGSVHCVVTSPPYYGLRDYGVAGQLGLEAAPDAYIATMVGVFREVRRVLRDDGTCWVNIGDAYCSGTATDRKRTTTRGKDVPATWSNRSQPQRIPASGGMKPKDLLMMPARLALALQADGWWLRSDIIWAKPNPMPESVTDRPTSAHEHVYLLSKSARYFYDADAVREEQSEGTHTWVARAEAPDTDKYAVIGNNLNGGLRRAPNPAGRNLRNVWTIATHAYPEAHFATFPPALAERCIKAGTSEKGCCPQCGAPWYRVVERGDLVPMGEKYDKRAYGVVVANPDANDAGRNRARDGHRANMAYENRTIGWLPTCACDKPGPPQPCTVLDPFAGAGTTGLVADRLQRNAVLIELNPAYCAMMRDRIVADAPLLAEVAD